ncbi:MAG: DUF5667 domain-containing protein [Patescibacteria group bacterium]|jgi:hypothetical protein
MEDLLNNISERSKRVALTEAEREFLRVRLVEYAASPRAGASENFIAAWLGFWRQSAFALRSSARPVLAAAMIVAILVGSAGVSYAAESAMPGDALYGFKLAVNEEVVSALAVTPEAQVRWETRRAERRLEEAEVLADAGDLDADKAAIIEERINAHAASAEEHLAEIDRGGHAREAAELGSELESALRGHAAVIGRLSEPDDRRAVGAANVIKTAEKQAGRAAVRRSDSEQAVTVPDNRRAAEASLADAEKKLTAVKEKFAEDRSRLTVKTIDQAGGLIALAEAAVSSGRAAMIVEKFNEAFAVFQEAGRQAQQAKMLISADQKWPEHSRGRETLREDGDNDTGIDDRNVDRGDRWERPQREAAASDRD